MKFKNYMKLISGGKIGNSNYSGTSLNGLIQEVKLKGKIPIQFLQFVYINKGDRRSHWVGHSDRKQWDINDSLKRKQIIEDMEDELTEALEISSNTDNLAVNEGANVDETTPIYLQN